MASAHLGPSDQAEDSLRRFLAEHPVFEGVPTFLLVWLLEIAVLIEDRELCSVLAQRLAPASFLSIGHYAWTCPARHLGAAAALLGEPDKARAYYHEALEAAGKIRFRPEIALIRFQLAELLLDHYRDDRAEAVEHLDFAIGEFRDMKMQPSLEKALEVQERLASSEGVKPSYPGGLTEKEVEVLRLIADGKTNQEIAGQLVISANTVARHVSNIFTKAGVANRAEAATYAGRQGLVS